jgi:poly(3-hydroxyoctanoate) depolymerase
VALPDNDRDFDLRIGRHRIRVSQRVGSDRDAPALLLLMGLGGSTQMWEPLRGILATLGGMSTIAFDIPGVGRSPTPRLPVPLPVTSHLAMRLLRELGIDRFDVLGLSWGGLLAQQMALTAPRRVQRLVLVNTNFGMGSVPGRPEALRTTFKLAPPSSRRGFCYQALSVFGWSSLGVLPLVRQPCLVLAGAEDRLSPVINARALARLMPRARLHVVSGGGHLFPLERPRHTAQLVAEFLAHAPGAREKSQPHAPGTPQPGA